MNPIRVVHITENPIAGAPIALSRALNEWSEGRVKSRHIALSDRNENRIYQKDLLINDESYRDILGTLAECNIVHFHNFYRDQALFRKWPGLWDIVKRKRRVWQAHTQRNIGWMDMEAGLRDKHAKHLVIAQYHPRMYPECEIVQNVVDIFRPEMLPVPRGTSTAPRVVYSPSRIRLQGWDSKGYDETAPVLQKLVNEGLVSADIIFDRPHAECLKRKQAGDIGIDEVITGSYHLCSLETLSQGLVTIANLDALQKETLEKVTGCPQEQLPWVCASYKNLELVLRGILALSSDELRAKQAASRSWMETYWHPKKIVAHFERIYREVV